MIIAEGEFLVTKQFTASRKICKLKKHCEIEALDVLLNPQELPTAKKFTINLGYLGKGQLFGEDSLIADQPYECSLVCN